METAQHIATILGPAMVIVSLWQLFCTRDVQMTCDSLAANPGTVKVAGIFNLLGGLTIISFYNHWAIDWGLLVTLFAWGMILKGALVFLSNDMMVKFRRSTWSFKLWGFLSLVWGGALCYVGFFMA